FGKIDNHCLKIEQCFETTLSEFGLVRRVGSVPPGIFENVSLNDWRRDAIVITGADERACDSVLFRDRAQLGKFFALRFRLRYIQLSVVSDFFAILRLGISILV